MTTDKTCCSIIAEVLAMHGVRHCVVSPGSRNAPVIIAFDACPDIELTVTTDERSAAFVALGMSQVSRHPVALVCTSGSAPLNYAPALAEAFYQGVPLIAISADRPRQWIDQDDSQTIRQAGALDNFVKRSFDLTDGEMPEEEHLWYANRIANEACITALSGKPGPIHINVQLHSPLTREGTGIPLQRIVEDVPTEESISRETALNLAKEAEGARILTIGGFCNPDYKLNQALEYFSKLPNVFILHETLANLHLTEQSVPLDTLICTLSEEEKERLRPDIVISFGGSVVSRFVKQYLRKFPPRRGHWTIGHNDRMADCFQSLSKRITSLPAPFFRRFGGALKNVGTLPEYHEEWLPAVTRALKLHTDYLNRIPWSDMKGLDSVFRSLPQGINLQLSNGTPVRYAQLLQQTPPHASYCNRGVSGIDGCTSTAVGAALSYKGLTLLITGDLSFTYDLSALAFRGIPNRLRIIVVNNAGGGIFRFVGTTSSLPENMREQYFCADPKLDFAHIATAFNMEYLYADNLRSLESSLDSLFSPSDRCILLEMRTDPDISADVLKNYFSTLADNGLSDQPTKYDSTHSEDDIARSSSKS